MIRMARLDDRDRVVRLLADSRKGAGFDTATGPTGFVFPFDPAYAARLFARYIAPGHMLCLVNDIGGIAQGVLMAHAFEHDFGPVWVAQERVWWIDPAHRGGTAAMRMLDDYERWAVGQGCEFASMAGMGDDPAVMKLYERRGYRAAELHCLKRMAA